MLAYAIKKDRNDPGRDIEMPLGSTLIAYVNHDFNAELILLRPIKTRFVAVLASGALVTRYLIPDPSDKNGKPMTVEWLGLLREVREATRTQNSNTEMQEVESGTSTENLDGENVREPERAERDEDW